MHTCSTSTNTKKIQHCQNTYIVGACVVAAATLLIGSIVEILVLLWHCIASTWIFISPLQFIHLAIAKNWWFFSRALKLCHDKLDRFTCTIRQQKTSSPQKYIEIHFSGHGDCICYTERTWMNHICFLKQRRDAHIPRPTRTVGEAA